MTNSSAVLKQVDLRPNKDEGNVLFNGTLNTFYLWLYCIGHMVQNHSNTKRGMLLLALHGLLILISSKGSFIYTIPDRIAHTTAFVTPVMEHWLKHQLSQSSNPSHHGLLQTNNTYKSGTQTIYMMRDQERQKKEKGRLRQR